MKRIFPYLVFLVFAGSLAVFIYKDKLFPPTPDPNAAARSQAGGGGGGGGGRRSGGQRRNGNQPVSVTVEKARTENVPVYLTAVGTVQANAMATVRAQVSGRVTELNYREGDTVKAGTVLVKIDPVLYQAAYDQAVAKKAFDQALMDNAKRDFARYASLVKSESTSQQQVDTAKSLVAQYEAQLRQDQAGIDTAKANLDYAIVRAPIGGRVGLKLVDPGNLVSSSDATGIVVIAQLQPISIVFTLPESNIADVIDAQKRGDVPLQVSFGGVAIAQGKVEAVDNQVDQTTGTVKIKGVFPNEDNRLWPGQFVNIRLQLRILENATVVPSTAVQQGANGSFVYLTTEEDRAKLVTVKITQEGEKQAVVGQGVAVGDTVVTSGFTSLQDNSRIRVATPGDPNASQGDRSRGNKVNPTGTDANAEGQRDGTAPVGADSEADKAERRKRREGETEEQRAERRKRRENETDAERAARRQRREGADAVPKDTPGVAAQQTARP